MRWFFENDGTWWAKSQYHATGVYWIEVCDDGSFDVSKKTDDVLTGGKKLPSFRTFDAACDWCDATEKLLRHGIDPEVRKLVFGKYPPPPPPGDGRQERGINASEAGSSRRGDD